MCAVLWPLERGKHCLPQRWRRICTDIIWDDEEEYKRHDSEHGLLFRSVVACILSVVLMDNDAIVPFSGPTVALPLVSSRLCGFLFLPLWEIGTYSSQEILPFFSLTPWETEMSTEDTSNYSIGLNFDYIVTHTVSSLGLRQTYIE